MLKNADIVRDVVEQNVSDEMFSDIHKDLVKAIFETYNETCTSSVIHTLSRNSYKDRLKKFGANSGTIITKCRIYDDCNYSKADIGDIVYLLRDLRDGYAIRKTSFAFHNYQQNRDKKGGWESASILKGQLDFLEVNSSAQKSRLVSLASPEDIEEYIKAKEQQQQVKTKIVKTGIDEIDAAMNIGCAEGTLTLVVAATGVGKTSLMLNMALNIAKKGHKILFVTIEMPWDRLWDRIASNLSGINFSLISHPGDMSPDQMDQVKKVMKEWKDNHSGDFSVLDTTETISVSQLNMEIERRAEYFKPDVLIVDYIGIVKPDRYRKDRQDLELGDIAKDLRRLGSKYKFGVITAAQLGREAIRRMRKDKDQSAGSDDVKGSQELASDCDFIFALFQSDEANKLRGQTVKSRYGKSFGTFSLFFDGATCRIGNYCEFEKLGSNIESPLIDDKNTKIIDEFIDSDIEYDEVGVEQL